MDGQIWALKANSLTSPLIVTVTDVIIYDFLICALTSVLPLVTPVETVSEE